MKRSFAHIRRDGRSAVVLRFCTVLAFTGPAVLGSEVEVSITPVHTEIAELEPFQFRMVVENVSGARLEGLRHPALLSTTRVTVRTASEGPWVEAYVPYYFRDDLLPYAPPPRMAAGGSITLPLCTFNAANEHDIPEGQCFPRPGEYEVRVEYEYRENQFAVSEPVKVRVVELVGVDARAADYLRQQKHPYVLYSHLFGLVPYDNTGFYSRECYDVSNAIIERFPGSRYEPWAKYCLAHWRGRDVFVGREKVLKDVPEAMRLAREVLDDESADIRVRRLSADLLVTLGATDVPTPEPPRPEPGPTPRDSDPKSRERGHDRPDAPGDADHADVGGLFQGSTIIVAVTLAVVVIAFLLFARRSS